LIQANVLAGGEVYEFLVKTPRHPLQPFTARESRLLLRLGDRKTLLQPNFNPSPLNLCKVLQRFRLGSTMRHAPRKLRDSRYNIAFVINPENLRVRAPEIIFNRHIL
jgi:hypothetical protein